MTKQEIIERIEDLLESSIEEMNFHKRQYEITEAEIYYYNYEEELGKVNVLTKLLKEVKENEK